MKAMLKQNAFVRFISLAGILYLALYIIYTFIIKKFTYYDQHFIGSIINWTENLLHLFGYKTFKMLQDRDMQVIGIDGGNGVWIGSNCNAITLFSLFSVFIIAYPGRQKDKWWFILSGIVAIHLLNILRVAALALIDRYAGPRALDFNHTYTFTFLVYAFIFGLWMLWINKFSGREVKSES